VPRRGDPDATHPGHGPRRGDPGITRTVTVGLL